MSIFANPLTESAEYEQFAEKLLKGPDPVGISGCIDSQKVHLMSTFLGAKKLQLVVTYSEQRMREIEEDYRLFSGKVYAFPPKDLIFFQADLQSNVIAKERLKTLEALFSGEAEVIITTADALMNRLPPAGLFEKHRIRVQTGEELDPEQLKHSLVVMGYQVTGRVEEPGQFASHGGILDIFPMTADDPLRIEFFDTEVDTIRTFDAETQRSLENMKEAFIGPATELVTDKAARERAAAAIRRELEKQKEFFRSEKEPDKVRRLQSETAKTLDQLDYELPLTAPDSYVKYFYPRTVTFADYLSEKDTLVFLDEPTRLLERGDGILKEFEESMKMRLEQGYALPGQTDLVIPADRVLASFERSGVAAMSMLEGRMSGFVVPEVYALSVQNMSTYKEGFALLIKDLKRWKREKYRVVWLCPSRTRGQRLAKQLQEEDLLIYYTEEEKSVSPGEIMVTCGNLHRGFIYPLLKFIVLTEDDVFGQRRKKQPRRPKYEGKKIVDFADLHPGDYVVHENYGLGIYRGTEKQTVDRVTKDFIKIEYGDGGRLFFPVTQLHLIQKYASSDAKQPKLNRLSGSEWRTTKARVQKAVAGLAKELVELYAARQRETGYEYGPDTVWQKEFEEMVPFEETEDQLAAIADTKKDMESPKIMDRLICGDVGYGKTEVAIRAAFKAVQESRQVVFLCPTTILAQQHYNTFVQRMKDYPVTIELLSRFRSSAQIKKTVEHLKAGLVDIVIGTHRVLSKDVQFKDLGLLIVDEEQRFGVAHKEKIKQLRRNIDVLTLTATPIPRTLHMSLIGIRDMSLLEEAPQERRPIQTYVMEMNWEMVREAINRELARDGQVYYVYNRVKDIAQIAAQVQELVPEARVAYAHGQMSERMLEQIMMDFVAGEIDILVSTTIIETGLDIPNVNTIVIHDADRYGLSQLYQLRGRVGRSNRTAYAFILYQTGKMLKEEAEKRLSAIREYTELGSGIKIAMKDLEIRGAGNLLGAEQHGHMDAVGYDLYCKMLNTAVKKEKGEMAEEEEFETVLEMPVSAYIPESYIRGESERMEAYKRIAAVEDEKESMDLVDELIDRFGSVPQPVMNLLAVAQLRSLAHSIYINEVKGNGRELCLFVQDPDKYRIDDILPLMDSYEGALQVIEGKRPYFQLKALTGKVRERELGLEHLKKLLNEIKGLLVS